MPDKYLRIRRLMGFGPISIALLIPAQLQAQAALRVCIHPSGVDGYYMLAHISVIENGAEIQIKPVLLENKCYRVNVPDCTDAVTIKATSGRAYSGETTCRTKPTPLLLAMKADREEIISTSLGLTTKTVSGGFNVNEFVSELKASDAALAKLPPKAKVANAKMYEALANRDYGAAQWHANEVAGLLRKSGNEKLSLAYSSLTYFSGFKAIGYDPLSPDDKLVTTVGSLSPKYVVLSPKGKKALTDFQLKYSVTQKLGVWDFKTAQALLGDSIIPGQKDTPKK